MGRSIQKKLQTCRQTFLASMFKNSYDLNIINVVSVSRLIKEQVEIDKRKVNKLRRCKWINTRKATNLKVDFVYFYI